MKLRKHTKLSQRVFRGRLAEDYDGIGQYVTVSLAHGSVSAAYKARVAAGDFGGGRRFPAGTSVTVLSYRGQLEVLLGNLPKSRCEEFKRIVLAGWGTGPLGEWLQPEGNVDDFSVEDGKGRYGEPGTDNQYNAVLQTLDKLPIEYLAEFSLRGITPFAGWSGSSAGGFSDFEMFLGLHGSVYFGNSQDGVTLFSVLQYPNTVMGIQIAASHLGGVRQPIGESDFDDVAIDISENQQLLGPYLFRLYVDDHGTYGRVWPKNELEPKSGGNTLIPFHSNAVKQAQWLATGGGKGEGWHAYAASLEGYTNPIAGWTMLVTGGIMSNADGLIERICRIR